MFGPNTHTSVNSVIDNSHRDKEFFEKVINTRKLFQKTFNLENYDILFIPGSGTIGMESVIWSVNTQIKIIGPKGKFASRWEGLSKLHATESKKTINLFCQLETSIAEVYSEENCIVDAISSFPYYDLPDNTKIFVTCINKQIGGIPGMAIVGVHKDFWSNIRDSSVFSYLNLSLYNKYLSTGQTPTTPAVCHIDNLYQLLMDFDIDKLRRKIDSNSEKLTKSIGSENIIGITKGPVICVKKHAIPLTIATKYQLYGINSDNNLYYLFTYSVSNEIYEQFIKDLNDAKTIL